MLTISRPQTGTPTLDPAGHVAAEITNRLLERLGRGTVTAIAPAPFAGRNGTWSMTVDGASKIFVKRISSLAAGPQSFARAIAFADFAERSPEHAPASPRLLGIDPEHSLLVFEHCPGTSLAHLLVQEHIPESFSVEAGRLLGRLHSGPTLGLVPITPPSPPVEMLALGVPYTRYLSFTIAEMALWSELQRDEELIAAAAGLRDEERRNRRSPVHGDLRLDQFHVDGERLLLLDWDEFGLGDPARDLGMLAGEWIYRAVLDAVTTREGASAPPIRFDEESATERIAERMTALVPRIRRMWLSYLRHSPAAVHDDDRLALRATAHLGWHLVDRTIARAPMVSRLPGIERAAAGIGRKALLAPGEYSHALGFERRDR